VSPPNFDVRFLIQIYHVHDSDVLQSHRLNGDEVAFGNVELQDLDWLSKLLALFWTQL